MMKINGKLKRYLQNYKFNSLFFRNLLLLLVLIIVPLTGAIVISYYAYSSMQLKEQQNSSEKIVHDVYATLERVLKEAKTDLMYVGINSNVELYMYDEDVRQFNYKIRAIQELIKMPALAKDYVDSVWVYSVKSNRVITLQGVAEYQGFSGQDKIEKYLNQEGAKSSLLVTGNEMENRAAPQLTVFQEIKYGKQLNGIALMNLNMDELLKELNIADNVEMFLTDGKSILLASEKELIGRPVEEIPEYDRVIHDGTGISGGYSVSSLTAKTVDLEVITRMDMSGYHNQISSMRLLMFTFLAVMTLITLGLAVIISVRLFQPIEEIITSLQEYYNVLVGGDDLFQDKDELEYILNSIRKTAKERKDVDEELAERVRLLKKAQAVALQSQINPHFINNTLETINWSAIELLGGRNEISQMSSALSRMLRMTMENSDTVVTVCTEMQHCMYYLEIQRKRYEDKFDVDWQIPEDIMDCRMIRIVLQPLVENAIYHGMKPMTNKGLITISGKVEGELLFLTVSDNGLGMTGQALENLRRNMQSDMIKESHHIGMTNVNQRIRLYYGDDYGLIVDSREGIGTSVTVRIPSIRT